MRVLITGAGGFVGRALAGSLSRRHELTLLDVRPEPVAGCRILAADVRSLAEMSAACRGVGAVIHLAVASGREGDVEDDEFNALRFDVNVRGTWTVFEAARRAGVQRVIYTSSIMVDWGYGPGEFVGRNQPPRPVGTYALTKLLGEQIASHYHRAHGMEVVCLRIAKPVLMENLGGRVLRPQWIPMPDLCRAYELALAVEVREFVMAHLVGESSKRRWDLTAARDHLGYVPQIRWDDFDVELDEAAPLS